MSSFAQLVALVEDLLVASPIAWLGTLSKVTPSAAVEALHMLEPLFFFYLLELVNIRATICKVSHFMTPVAHGMRELSLL